MSATLKKEKMSYLVLLLPTIIPIVLLILIPILSVFGISLTNFSMLDMENYKFVGVSNYIQMFHDARFWNSVRVALIMCIGTVGFQMLLGLWLALLLCKNYRFFKYSRAIFLLPMTVPPIVSGVIWKLMFNPTLPGVNYLLSLIGIQGPTWFDNAGTAMSTIIIATVWQWTPFVMLLLIAALESMPIDPFESARIDGANRWQIFRFITLPMLKPTLMFVATYRVIESLKNFPLVYMLTQGGPGISTEPMNYYAYEMTFKYSKMGYGSTLIISILMIVILIVVFLVRKEKETVN